MAQSLLQLVLLLCLSWSTCSDGGGNKTVTLLALVPYPQPRTNNHRSANVAIPAIRLATKHINEREDVLPGYTLRVVEANSGCWLWLNSVVHFTQHVFHAPSGQPVAGVIGPACTASSQVVGRLSAMRLNETGVVQSSLLQIGSSNGPSPSGENRFHNTFRISTAEGFVNAFVSLIEERKWSRFAALYQTANFFTSVFQTFLSRTEGQLVYSAGLSEDFIPLEAIRERYRVRVVFMFVASDFAADVMCYAYHLDMLYPLFQWVFHSRTVAEIVRSRSVRVGDKTYSCTENEMREAARGVILNLIELEPQNPSSTNTVAKMSYISYREGYRSELDKFANELKRKSYDLNVADASKEAEYSNGLYDAVWAMVLAMNDSLPELSGKGYNLETYNYSLAGATNIIRKHLLNTTFNGMSGTVEFSDTLRDNLGTAIKIVQIQPNLTLPSTSSDAVTIAYYSDLTNIMPAGSYEAYSDALWIDSTDFEVRYVGSAATQTYILLLNAVVILIVTVSLQLVNVCLNEHKSMKATSTHLSYIIFSGCYLFIIALISYVGFNGFFANSLDELSEQDFIAYSVNCNLYAWCSMMGYSLIFGTVLVKSWRIYRIFTSFRRPHFILISDESLVAFVIGMLLVDVVLLVTLSFTDPLLLHREETFNGQTIDIFLSCQTKSGNPFPPALIVLLLFKLCQCTLVVMMAILTRKVHKGEYKTTKELNVLVYIHFLLIGLFAILYIILHRSRIGTQLVSFYILLTFVVLCDIFLFVPPVWRVFIHKKRNKRHNALLKGTMPSILTVRSHLGSLS